VLIEVGPRTTKVGSRGQWLEETRCSRPEFKGAALSN